MLAKVQGVIQAKFSIPSAAIASTDSNTFNAMGVVNSVHTRIW
jgi:hypothetical protein